MTDTTTAARPAHTPGPWAVDSGEALNVRAPHGGIVAQLHHLKGRHGMGGRLPGGEAVANARLIAAAPELLEALKEVTHCLAWHAKYHGTGMDGKAVAEARSVIAKATGSAS